MKNHHQCSNNRYHNNSRPTIGFLNSGVTDYIGYRLWTGAMDAARELDVNLICFSGKDLNGPNLGQRQANYLYELVSADRLDGLVLSGGIMTSYAGMEGLISFCKKNKSIPKVVFHVPYPGIPSVVVDNYNGVYELVSHLIEVHHHRSIAFIPGPWGNLEAQIRFSAYKAALMAHDIPFNLKFVSEEGNWHAVSGAKAIAQLLDESREHFQSVVCANDGMAVGAIDYCNTRGINVPYDLAIVGYDDEEGSRFITPPLTTVHQPLYKMVYQAVELILAQHNNEEVPMHVNLTSSLIIRQSCGCLPMIQNSSIPKNHDDHQIQIKENSSDTLIARLQKIFDNSVKGDAYQMLGQLLVAFNQDLHGESNDFFSLTFNRILNQVIKDGGSVILWQEVISVIRLHYHDSLTDMVLRLKVENLCYIAQMIIGQTAERAQGYYRLQTDMLSDRFGFMNNLLLNAGDIELLSQLVMDELSRKGIPSCYVALYDRSDPAEGMSSLILGYNENGKLKIDNNKVLFPSMHLIPDEYFPQNRRYSYVVEALYIREEQLGYVLFETGSNECLIYDNLRAQLSSTLKSIMLLEEHENLRANLYKRTLQLETAAEVSQASSFFLNLNELLQRMVELIHVRFNLQYVGLFLLNEEGKAAVLRSSSGLTDHKIRNIGDQLIIDESSLIGWCIINGYHRVITYQNPPVVKKTAIPFIHHEVGLPLIGQGTVIGAMFIQSSDMGEFDQEDLTILRTMADQLANAINNAHLYNQAQMEIHDRQQAETQLNQTLNELKTINSKLAQLDDLKNDFIANITHDFRSPLMIILNTIDLGLKYDNPSDPNIKRRFNIVLNAAIKLKTSIDRLLDLAKMDAKGLKLKVKRVKLRSYLEKIVDFYKSTTMFTNIKIYYFCPKHEIHNFYTDEDKLEEIVNNLLSNALKFINPENGEIVIELEDKNDRVIISIKDNGIGIPEEKLEYIFGRFQQVESGPNSWYRGTGIGLAFSKQLMEYLKGSIQVSSIGKGMGTTFILELKKGKDVFNKEDFCQEEIDDTITMQKREEWSRMIESDLMEKVQTDKIMVFLNELNNDNEFDYHKGIILIIDDNKLIREIEKEYLENAGYKNFILVSDGKRGIEAAYSYRPDMIICDYNMPNMKGDEFHDSLITNPDFERLPFIFLSAIADKNIIADRKKKGAVAYLRKPVDEMDLLSTVEIHMKSHMKFKETLQHATIDELTGINNRSSIMKLLRSRILSRVYRPLSIIFFDIDHFKLFNDTYGHHLGDKVLSTVGKVIKESIRVSDIAGRYGGEEFLLILPETDIRMAEIVAEKVRNAIKNNKLCHNGQSLTITASFGISSLIDNAQYLCNELKIDNIKRLFELDNSENISWSKIEGLKLSLAEKLVKMADEALYLAKSTVCKNCDLKSQKHEEFIQNKCPNCQSDNISIGRDRVVLFQ